MKLHSNLTMKQFSNVKSQAMVFVLFILGVFGALAGGLTVMWESEIRTRTTGRESLIAFYLAQAAAERAKREVLNNVIFSGNAPAWYNDMDVATDSYIFRYNCGAASSGTQRTITGRGEVLDANNNILAHREIQIAVDGIEDTPPLTGQDDDMNGSLQAGSWQEL